MPHPPISTYNAVPTESHVILSPSWSPGSLNHVYGTEVGSLNARVEPASTKNPVRSDGTRAPSAYHIYRVAIANPHAAVSSAPSGGWFAHHTGNAPRLAQFGGSPSVADVMNYILDGWTNVDALARTKFLNKLADASGKDQVQLGVAAGEVRETFRMAAELGEGLVKGVADIATSVRRPPKSIANALYVYRSEGAAAALRQLGSSDMRLLEQIVNSWLVVQFGLKPLAYDVYDGSVWLQAAQPEGEPLQLPVTLKGGASEEVQFERMFCQQGHNGSPCRIMGRFTQTSKVDYAGVYKIPTKAPLPMQLGLYNPALVAWELLRFTWMVDYVIDVGGWLRSFMAAEGTSFVEGSRSVKLQARLNGLRSEAWISPRIEDPAKGPMMFEVDKFFREVLNHGVMPSFIPGMKNKLNANRLANSIAAVTSLVAARHRAGPGIINP